MHARASTQVDSDAQVYIIISCFSDRCSHNTDEGDQCTTLYNGAAENRIRSLDQVTLAFQHKMLNASLLKLVVLKQYSTQCPHPRSEYDMNLVVVYLHLSPVQLP